MTKPQAEPKGSGSLRDESGALTAGQKETLLAYMDLYYISLAELSPGDPAALFAADARDQAEVRGGVWRTIIAIRSAQEPDLSLIGYTYELTCTEVDENEDGDITVSANEYSVQNFAAYPGVDAESFDVRHRFTLTETAEGWRLRAHMQMEMSNWLAAGRSAMGSRGGAASADEDLDTRRDDLLAAHRREIAQRRRQADGAAASYTTDHPYDRAAAVAYAQEWVGRRNTADWPSYDRNGGNCQNYISQAMYAGGIAMDYMGGSQWKWYGSSPDTAQAATGRSGSWSGVNEFYAYARDNTGYGMAAQVDAPFWCGEPGDLVQLGYEDRWRHVVMITEVVRDEDGGVVDYLICSNTADLRSYPLSAYFYPQQRLIKIYGWNG